MSRQDGSGIVRTVELGIDESRADPEGPIDVHRRLGQDLVVGGDAEDTIEIEVGRGKARLPTRVRLLSPLRYGGGRQIDPPPFVVVLSRNPGARPHIQQEREAPEGPLDDRLSMSPHYQ